MHFLEMRTWPAKAASSALSTIQADHGMEDDHDVDFKLTNHSTFCNLDNRIENRYCDRSFGLCSRVR